MKKIIYSAITKFIAVVLFIASIVSCAMVVFNGITDYGKEDYDVYHFENSFNESRYLTALCDAVESTVYHMYHDYYSPDSENQLTPHGNTIEEMIKEELENLSCYDKVNFYVKWNETEYTNCDAKSEDELTSSRFYRLTKRDENGNVNIESYQPDYHWYSLLDELSHYDDPSSIVICASVKEEHVNECEAIWIRQHKTVTTVYTCGTLCALFALALLIYLLSVCGKNEAGELKLMWIDNIWIEFHLLTIIGVVIGSIFLIGNLFFDIFNLDLFAKKIALTFTGICAGLTGLVFITSLLSIVRNIKAGRFMKVSSTVGITCWGYKSVLKFFEWLFKTLYNVVRWFFVTVFKAVRFIIITALKIIRWFFRSFFGGLRWIRNKIFSCLIFVFKTFSKLTGIVLITLLIVYTILIGIFGIFLPESPMWLVFGIILFLIASVIIAIRVIDFDTIKKGVREIRGGNVSYKIPEPKNFDMKPLAENINDIAKGLDESVAAKVKAEKMKTELITNVSHDLKTPITSIINYTELLSQFEDLPEEARDYVAVIAKKGERLKTLTEDLFNISKVQSGNENVVFEKLDVALLISQSIAEHDNEIKNSKLPFCVSSAKDLYILADGRKMSRVISNLINNILKYTMKNTRVFITASEKNGEILLEFKNISSYPMDFTADDIVGRFVRGDASRTGDGNGLGLAIAKSYTELCGGKFEVKLDGDLFKVILKFKKEI